MSKKGFAFSNSHPVLFVLKKDTQSNRLIVVQGKNNPKLFSSSLIANKLHWISGEQPTCGSRLRVKIRHSTSSFLGTITHKGLSSVLNFDIPQRAVAPGQSVVFYKGPVCIGGGIITNVNVGN